MPMWDFLHWLSCRGNFKDVVQNGTEWDLDGSKQRRQNMVEVHEQELQNHHLFFVPLEVARDCGMEMLLRKEKSLFHDTGCVFLPSTLSIHNMKKLAEDCSSSYKDWSDLECEVVKWVNDICNLKGNEGKTFHLCEERRQMQSSGYAARLDNPRLSHSFNSSGNFITVMIAIDDMTTENGCIQVLKGKWSKATALSHHESSGDLILDNASTLFQKLPWEHCVCRSGDIFILDSWVPHRSAGPNATEVASRAVLLTYCDQAKQTNLDNISPLSPACTKEEKGHIGLRSAATSMSTIDEEYPQAQPFLSPKPSSF